MTWQKYILNLKNSFFLEFFFDYGEIICFSGNP